MKTVTIEQGQTAYCVKRIGRSSKRSYITGVCFDRTIAEAWVEQCKKELPNADWRIEVANVELRNPSTMED